MNLKEMKEMTLGQLEGLKKELGLALAGMIKRRGRPPFVLKGPLDWSKTNKVLADEHGVSTNYISHKRKDAGAPKVTKYWPSCRSWDWEKPDTVLGRELHVAPATIAKLRSKCGYPPGPSERTVRTADITVYARPDVWADVDWNKHDAQIAREVGKTREAARQQRCKRGIPKCIDRRNINHLRFMEEFAGVDAVSFREAHQKLGVSYSTFRKYMIQSGKRILTSDRRKIRPWHLINWDIPNIILLEIWKIPWIPTKRSNYMMPRPKFRSHLGSIPDQFKPVVEEEKRKAGEYYASKCGATVLV